MRYVIDKVASRFTVQAFATGPLSVFGHNPNIAIRDFEGDVQFIPESYDQASLRVAVQTATFEVLDEMNKDDREKLERDMFQNVLEVDHFPTAVYQSNQISVREVSDGLMQVRVDGDLTLHGVSHPHSFDSRVLSMGTMLRISGEFSLRQSDYAIKPVSIAGGALKLKDQLGFKFEMVARQNP